MNLNLRNLTEVNLPATVNIMLMKKSLPESYCCSLSEKLQVLVKIYRLIDIPMENEKMEREKKKEKDLGCSD